MIVKLDPTIYRKIYGTTNMANQCYTYNKKDPIWNIKSSTTILEIAIRDTTGVGIHTEPIQQICSQ